MKNFKRLKEITPADSRYIPLTQQRYCCVPTCIQMVMIRHGIPLVPAELIGYHMGLILPEEAAQFFWHPRTGAEPSAGYGTQAGDPRYAPNAVFKKLQIPLKMSWALINTFKTLTDFKMYLANLEKSEKDVLVCYDWPTLFDAQEKRHWGHVCVLDRVAMDREIVRIIDPSQSAPKWREVSIPDLYKAMVFHGMKNSGGFWEIVRA